MSCCLSLVLRLFCFVSFLFILLSLKPRPFVQSFFVLRYTCVPIARRSKHCPRPFSFLFLPFFSPFFSSGDVAFSEYCFTIAVISLYGEYVVHFFLPGGIFLPCDHGLDF